MRNPLRIFERNVNKNKKNDFETIKSIFFYDIFDIFVNRYKWNGLPEEILPMYIEQTLFWHGLGVFIKDNIAGYAFMKVSLSGLPDIYNIPQDRIAYTANGYIEEYGKENSCILWNNYSTMPFYYKALMYADAMANTWKTKDINMYAQRTPIVLSSSDNEKLSFEIVGEEYDNYLPIIKLSDSLNLKDIKALNIGAPYIVDKCEQELRDLWSQVLTSLGYESNPVEKGERLVTGETAGNNGQIEANRNVGLTLRRRCAAAINELWGLNVTVDFNSELPTMMNGYVPDKYMQKGKEGDEIE